MSSITSDFDWMLTRDRIGSRKDRRLGAELPATPVSCATVAVPPLRPVDKGGIGVLSQELAAGRRLSGET